MDRQNLYIISRPLKFFFILFLYNLISNKTLEAQEKPLVIEKLNEHLYLYTTFQTYNGTPVSSNALYLITEDGVVLFDTPWDPTQYQPLLDSIQQKHNKKVIAIYATHWHEDRAGGFAFYNKKGIPTYATDLTNKLLADNKKAIATHIVNTGEMIYVGGERFQMDFFGAGHSLDNTVIWFPVYQVLHGGCFIKSAQATDLGFTGDGDIKQWKPSLARLMAHYPDIELVIPGHDDWRKNGHIKATNRLLDTAN
ncbi:BlaB/IND/MUS family subclass B1 metallo-beta-lactamase [Sphingobacterium shayense]|uniref:BlaB/IND/MUS family subclass B1 metallo-beta-lactamase n=1 Tax=Sphingobacterium shayense TaxID=626343 RepID=UPI00155659E0|nr:BlaB/IND/MUS family subclass B1 metallo-beta-lactamase [Sphingobacterium shayense]NQD71254.1 BlaB/IND/MUS family subclass B1 metallo-beta-lactamase [Sphingobacterium shayense]